MNQHDKPAQSSPPLEELSDPRLSLARAVPPAARRHLVGRPLGEICAELYQLSATQLGDALDAQAQKGGPRLGEILIEKKLLGEREVLAALAAQLDVPFLAELHADAIPDELVRAVPIGFAKQNHVVTLGRTPSDEVGGGVIIVACADPLDTATLDELRILLKCELELALAPPDLILLAINSAYDRATAKAEHAVADLEEGPATEIGEEINEPLDLLDVQGDDEAPIIRLVNSLFSQAVKERASDIHIEPFETSMLVRFRVDGVLHEIIKPPKRFQNTIISRVKIMAGLNIAEKRLPQDGRIRLKVAGRDIDVRVSTVPTTYGERIVMRLLDRSSVLRDLDTIGFSPRNYAVMTSLINKSHGIILVTGPTGSGKTSTLYACLAKINSPDLNILTIEDPVEYQLKGIGQVQVQPKINLTFANGLRSFLRQDPDVIMVGEIRDRETAEIAIQASLTGHLVLSTVHTNDAPSAVTRLVDMGIEPFLIASSLIGVLAQRLVRTICPKCKVEYQPTAEELRGIGIGQGADAHKVKTLWKGKGCPTCQNTGYLGRTGIYELMLIDDEVRHLILARVDANSIKAKAREHGMITLQADGTDKVLQGITTAEEVSRVTQEDSMSLEAFG
ncbi:MAG: type II secretion system protein GspE [Deltaproteobacteria bacterium RBG_16_71_12]|nr:MAG: type II secretion system protein GspE [Deltaproteobacteria bacterium RBG_16_71_12]